MAADYSGGRLFGKLNRRHELAERFFANETSQI